MKRLIIILSSILLLSACGGGGEPCTIADTKIIAPNNGTGVYEYYLCREEQCPGHEVYRTCRREI